MTNAPKDFGEGIFDMEFINTVNDEKDFRVAKQMAYDKIEASKVKDENKRKATAMVAYANNKPKLLFGMTNFSLSHQGLKAIR